MNLSQVDYAKQPADYGIGKRRNEDAFRELVEYRLYEDLRRGWRIVQPNLEQCGLLIIEYCGLQSACADSKLWQEHSHPVLLKATPEQRYVAAKALLDLLRKELVIDAALLQPERLEQLKREVEQAIKEPWKFDDYELLHEAAWATTVSGEKKGRAKLKLTAKGKIGRFLRSVRAWDWLQQPLSEAESALAVATSMKEITPCAIPVKTVTPEL